MDFSQRVLQNNGKFSSLNVLYLLYKLYNQKTVKELGKEFKNKMFKYFLYYARTRNIIKIYSKWYFIKYK